MGVDLSRSTAAPGGGSMLDRIGSESGGLGAALGQGFSGLIGGIGNALRGIFTPGGLFAPVGEAMKPIHDGQHELKDRTDLLSPLLDYGTVFAPEEGRRHGLGFVPLTRQLGPMRGCELINDHNGGIRLLGKGLWDIRAQVTFDYVVTVLEPEVMGVQIRVYRPNGTLYSVQNYQEKSSAVTTCTIVSSVVVPASDYRVGVYIGANVDRRGLLGGPAWTRLTAQHISNEVNGNWGRGNENSQAPSG